MINLIIKSGRSIPRWQKWINIMIEKDKNSPIIDRLRILQLFEADMNMFLKVIVANRMMYFANKHCHINKLQYGSRNGKLFQSAIGYLTKY